MKPKSFNEKSLKKKEKHLNNKINNIHDINHIDYFDYELNSLLYKDALKYDSRDLLHYYINLVKIKHPILFSFYPKNDYNSKIVKIDLFFLSFSIYYFINTLFFNESIIHKIYEDKGTYNLYLIPYIIYSIIISHFLTTLIKFFSLSERNVFELKRAKTLKISEDKFSDLRRCLIIKYSCFYIISMAILIFFWYYLSSFGAVYRNTQKYVIINILTGFGFSMLCPFAIILIPSVLRIYALKKSNRQCIYKTSKILQFL
jgi:hypothetical protein